MPCATRASMDASVLYARCRIPKTSARCAKKRSRSGQSGAIVATINPTWSAQSYHVGSSVKKCEFSMPSPNFRRLDKPFKVVGVGPTYRQGPPLIDRNRRRRIQIGEEFWTEALPELNFLSNEMKIEQVGDRTGRAGKSPKWSPSRTAPPDRTAMVTSDACLDGRLRQPARRGPIKARIGCAQMSCGRERGRGLAWRGQRRQARRSEGQSPERTETPQSE